MCTINPGGWVSSVKPPSLQPPTWTTKREADDVQPNVLISKSTTPRLLYFERGALSTDKRIQGDGLCLSILFKRLGRHVIGLAAWLQKADSSSWAGRRQRDTTPREDDDSSSISLSGGVLQPQHSILRDHFSLSRINPTLNDTVTPTPMDPRNRTSSTSSSSLPRPLDHFFTDDVADDIVALFRSDGDVNSTASNAATNAATPTDGLDELARSWEV